MTDAITSLGGEFVTGQQFPLGGSKPANYPSIEITTPSDPAPAPAIIIATSPYEDW